MPLRWSKRDSLLYAVGVGSRNLRFIFEGHPEFATFPTYAINFGLSPWHSTSQEAIPLSPGPFNINAEQTLEVLRPLPTSGEGSVRARVVGVHPRGKGSGFVESESLVTDAHGNECARIIGGLFVRGVAELGDIEPFTGLGTTYSQKIERPQRPPDVTAARFIPDNQAHIFRLSGDSNPLHIDPASAKVGGFDEPILHGMCTFAHCASMLLEHLCDGEPARFSKIKVRFSAPVFLGDTLCVRAWLVRPGRVLFEAAVGSRVVVSNAYFEFSPASKL